jgi:hypothetical protein
MHAPSPARSNVAFDASCPADHVRCVPSDARQVHKSATMLAVCDEGLHSEQPWSAIWTDTVVAENRQMPLTRALVT